MESTLEVLTRVHGLSRDRFEQPGFMTLVESAAAKAESLRDGTFVCGAPEFHFTTENCETGCCARFGGVPYSPLPAAAACFTERAWISSTD